MSLRARAALASGLALALAVGLAAFVVYAATRAELRGQVDSSLREGAQSLAHQSIATPVRADRPSGREGGAFIPRKGATEKRKSEIVLAPASAKASASLAGVRGFTQYITPRGPAVPNGEPGPFPVTERAEQVAAGKSTGFFEDVRERGVHLRVYTSPIRDGLAVQVARSVEETDHVLARLRAILLLACLGGVVLAAGIGLTLGTMMLAPVRRLTAAAERVALTRKLDEPIAEDRKDELGRLARAFNSMLGALRSSVAAQRQLVADASHELRTPLTSILTNVEVLGDEPALRPHQRQSLVVDTAQQVRELGKLVSNLVELARADQPSVQTEPLRLDDLVDGCIERARAVWPRVEFGAELEESRVVGDREALERAVRNLLENAAKWSPAGGRVVVRVTDGEVTVRDEGPGIDENDLPHVFDRFYRAPTARAVPGSGLGLAIVRQVAEAHGGTVRAERAAPGSVFRLRIPSAVT